MKNFFKKLKEIFIHTMTILLKEEYGDDFKEDAS